MEHDPNYTVIVRGKTFVLSKSQIEFDSPNYFTSCFMGDFRESRTRRVKLSRDPDIFKIVVDHLCGYTVLPLNDNHIPTHLTPDAVLANLQADAEFYQLDSLINACKDLSSAKEHSEPPYRALLGVIYNTPLLEVPDYSKFLSTYVSEEEVLKEPFSSMIRAESCTGFAELRVRAAVEEALAKRLGADYRSQQQLVGWSVNTEDNEEGRYRTSNSEVAILLRVVRANKDFLSKDLKQDGY